MLLGPSEPWLLCLCSGVGMSELFLGRPCAQGAGASPLVPSGSAGPCTPVSANTRQGEGVLSVRGFGARSWGLVSLIFLRKP